MNELMIKQYEGTDVFFQLDGWFNATIVAARYGKQPAHWLRTDQAKELISTIMRKRIIEQNQLVKVRRGATENGGGTWMHPKLAVHFAYWLDVEFGFWVGEEIEQILIQRANPQFALPTMVPHWLFNFPVVDHETDVRFKGTRNSYISMLSRLNFRAPIYKQYITDMVNEILMGRKARPFRRMFRIPAGSRRRTRLYVDGTLRTAMQTVEQIASDRIQREEISSWVEIQQVVAEVARTVRGDFLRRNLNLIEHIPNIRQRPLTRVVKG